MVRSDGCGSLRWNVTSWSPCTVTSCRLKYQDLRGFLRSRASFLPISPSQVHFTSALVNGLPSCHFTPVRSLKVNVLPSLPQAHDVARSGMMVSGLFWLVLGSKTTRLLNTDMNGMTVEIV